MTLTCARVRVRALPSGHRGKSQKDKTPSKRKFSGGGKALFSIFFRGFLEDFRGFQRTYPLPVLSCPLLSSFILFHPLLSSFVLFRPHQASLILCCYAGIARRALPRQSPSVPSSSRLWREPIARGLMRQSEALSTSSWSGLRGSRSTS